MFNRNFRDFTASVETSDRRLTCFLLLFYHKRGDTVHRSDRSANASAYGAAAQAVFCPKQLSRLDGLFAALYTHLVKPGTLSLGKLVDLLHTNPARRFGFGTPLAEGEPDALDRFSLRLFPGDCVLMVSDGVCPGQEDGWLREMLAQFDGANFSTKVPSFR